MNTYYCFICDNLISNRFAPFSNDDTAQSQRIWMWALSLHKCRSNFGWISFRSNGKCAGKQIYLLQQYKSSTEYYSRNKMKCLPTERLRRGRRRRAEERLDAGKKKRQQGFGACGATRISPKVFEPIGAKKEGTAETAANATTSTFFRTIIRAIYLCSCFFLSLSLDRQENRNSNWISNWITAKVLLLLMNEWSHWVSGWLMSLQHSNGGISR